MSLAEKRLFLLDMDGTIYLSETLFDGTKDFLRYVRESGGRYLFLTNNSSRGTDAYIAKMARLGIEAFPDDFLTSTDATIRYLQRRYLPDTVYYVCGTESLKNQLRLAGLHVAEQLRDEMNAMTNPTLAPYAKPGECMLRATAKAPTAAQAEELLAPMVQ